MIKIAKNFSINSAYSDNEVKKLKRDVPVSVIEKFSGLIEKNSGINLYPQKKDTLRISLHSRANILDLNSYQEYYELVKENESEFRKLLGLITVNETYFFRYPEQFNILKKVIIPKIAENKGASKKLRIWSAGCSTGEEAYSIAINLVEAIENWKDWDLYIMGTDVSNKALETATKGIYSKNSFRITPPGIKEKYFIRNSLETWRIKPFIKDLVHFAYHNLIKEPFPFATLGVWDVIFCRNVTIYFKSESTKRVINNFYQALNPEGYFFTGHSETLYRINPDFETKKYGDVFVFKKPGGQKRAERDKKRVLRNFDYSFPIKKKRLDFKVIIEEIKSFCEKGSVDKTISIIDNARENYPQILNNYEFLVNASYCYLDLERINDAIELIERAIIVNSLRAEAYYLQGIAFRRRKNKEGALESFKKAAYLNNNFPQPLIEAANVLVEMENFKEAIKYYRRAAETLKRQDIETIFTGTSREMRTFLERTCKTMVEELQKRGGSGR